MQWEEQSARTDKNKYCKLNNQTQCNFLLKRQNLLDLKWKKDFAKCGFKLASLEQSDTKHKCEMISRDTSGKFKRTAVVKLLIILKKVDFKEMN